MIRIAAQIREARTDLLNNARQIVDDLARKEALKLASGLRQIEAITLEAARRKLRTVDPIAALDVSV